SWGVVVVEPGHPELDHAFGFDDAFEDGVLLIFRVLLEDRSERFENLVGGLEKLGFMCVAGVELFHHFLGVTVSHRYRISRSPGAVWGCCWSEFGGDMVSNSRVEYGWRRGVTRGKSLH